VRDLIVILMSHVRLLVIGLALGLASHAAAADVVAVVSAKSSITTLTKAELEDIFLGRVNRFPNGAQAVPIDQAEDSAARGAFYAKLAGKSAAQMKSYWAKIIFTGRGQPPPQVRNDAELKKRIAENPAVIGYIEEGLVDSSLKVVQ
jgi:ABC-type phosphate transport system substrate-binding protein